MKKFLLLIILSFMLFFACGKKESKEKEIESSYTQIEEVAIDKNNEEVEENKPEEKEVEKPKEEQAEAIKEVIKESLPKGNGNLAILIDDAGGSLELAKAFASLDMNISFAVLPYLAKSREVNEYLTSKGHTVILHLPMEGSDTAVNDNTKGLLKTELSKEEMSEIFKNALDNVGSVRGFNNHMGSVFTSSKEAMGTVLSYGKERNLFYVDSRTIASSQGYKTAKEMNIPTAQCFHFLDNSKNVVDIEKELLRAARISQNKGNALVIGHFHKNMVEALANTKETLANSGINLIFVDEILE